MPAPIETPNTEKLRAQYQASLDAWERHRQDPEFMAWLRQRIDAVNKRYGL